MERSKSDKENSRAPAIDDSSSDVVDHERLARLVEPHQTPQAALATFAPSPPARKSSTKWILIALLLFGVAIFVGLLVFPFNLGKTPAPDAGDYNSTQPPIEQPPIPPHIERTTIAVPGGTFQMGRTRGLPQEGPAHTVTVAPFAMDNTEVTNGEYGQFVREMNYDPPSHWSGNSPIGGQEQMPVTNVSLEDANAFAAWRSKRDGVKYRLPTEEEWEYAARGGDQGNLYPWGNSWIRGRAATKDRGLATLIPVGSYHEGKARWGHLDMIGNVWEWTSSKASYYPGNGLTIKPGHQNWAIIRGGSLASDPLGDKAITNTYRDWIEPTTKNDLLGFRLVRDGS